MTLDKLIIAARLCLLAAFLVVTGNAIALFGSLPYLWLIYPVLAGSPCSYCSGSTQNTTSISITIASVANNVCSPGTPPDCTALNQTFVVDHSTGCSYNKNFGFTLPICTSIGYAISLNGTWQSDGSMKVTLVDGPADGNSTIVAQSSAVSTPRDCSDATGLSGLAMVVVVGLSPPTMTLRCDYTTATATVVP